MTDRILASWARATSEPYGSKLTRINLQMPLALREALGALAETEGVSVPELARRLLMDGVHEMERRILGRIAAERYAATLEARGIVESKWRDVDEANLEQFTKRRPRR